MPQKRLVLSWRNGLVPQLREERFSRMTYELEPVGEPIRISAIHEMDRPDSRFIDAVSHGWPHILASLKTLLETGESLVETRTWPEGGVIEQHS